MVNAETYCWRRWRAGWVFDDAVEHHPLNPILYSLPFRGYNSPRLKMEHRWIASWGRVLNELGMESLLPYSKDGRISRNFTRRLHYFAINHTTILRASLSSRGQKKPRSLVLASWIPSDLLDLVRSARLPWWDDLSSQEDPNISPTYSCAQCYGMYVENTGLQ